MNEVVMNILKEKPLYIPKILLKFYKKLNITEKELLILICLLNEGDKSSYNPTLFTEELNFDKYESMQLLNDLADKNLVHIKIENNKNGKKEEYIYLDFLYNKLLNLLLDDEPELEPSTNTDLFSLFEQELGRTISPMEVEIIKEWVHDGISEDLIKEALKEAIYNNVRNLKYIDRILYSWQQKGFKTKADIIKDKKNYRNNQKKTDPIYDYNWLEDE